MGVVMTEATEMILTCPATRTRVSGSGKKTVTTTGLCGMKSVVLFDKARRTYRCVFCQTDLKAKVLVTGGHLTKKETSGEVG